MNIGKLDRRITIQNQVDSQDAVTGEWKETWSDLMTIWGGKESMAAVERLQANQIISVGDEVYLVRHSTSINTTQRIKDQDDVTYEIRSVQEIGRKVGLRIIAQRLN